MTEILRSIDGNLLGLDKDDNLLVKGNKIILAHLGTEQALQAVGGALLLNSVSIGGGKPFTGYINVKDFGAKCDSTIAGVGTDDTAAVQAAIDSYVIGSGMSIYVPAHSLVSDSLQCINKPGISFVGPNHAPYSNSTTHEGSVAGFVCAPGWAATKPVIRVINTVPNATSSTRGGFLFADLALIPADSGGANGYGILFEKDTGAAKNDFLGRVYILRADICRFSKGVALDDSANHDFDAPTANGNGFGHVFIKDSLIRNNTYAVHANCVVNVLNVRDTNMMQCSSVTSNSYVTRTGGCIVTKSGSLLNVEGCDFEGSQVGVHTGAWSVNIKGSYFEQMYDAAACLVSVRDINIEGNYALQDASYPGTQEVYINACRNIRLDGNPNYANSGMYLVCASVNRDVYTSSPHRTKFSTDTTGSKTLDNKGVIVQSLSRGMSQPIVAANIALSTATLSNAAHTEGTERGPLGFIGRAAKLTASAINGGVTLAWNTVPVVAGNWLVSSLVLRPAANAASGGTTLLVQENLGLGAGLATAYSRTLDSTMIAVNDPVMLQWYHQVQTGEDANFSTTIKAQIRNNGDVQTIYGVAQVISDIPFVRPGSWEIFSSGGTEHYLTRDGQTFYGPNAAGSPPAAVTLTWRVGDIVWRQSPALNENLGWVCTTAGIGGTAVFQTMTNGAAGYTTSTWAARGSGSVAGEERLITDIGPTPGTKMQWDGTYWKVMSPTIVLLDSTLVTSGTVDNNEQVLKQLTIPVGLLRAGRIAIFRCAFAKNGTTDAMTSCKLRLGTAGTTADLQVMASASFAAVNRAFPIEAWYQPTTATNLRALGAQSGLFGYPGVGNTAAYQVNYTISDLDANALILSATTLMAGVTNAGAVANLFIELLP